MSQPFRADYHDSTGYLDIEYDRRVGYYSMTADHLHDHYELYYLLKGNAFILLKTVLTMSKPGILYLLTEMQYIRRWKAEGPIMNELYCI